jgi:hypothetical protein
LLLTVEFFKNSYKYWKSISKIGDSKKSKKIFLDHWLRWFQFLYPVMLYCMLIFFNKWIFSKWILKKFSDSERTWSKTVIRKKSSKNIFSFPVYDCFNIFTHFYTFKVTIYLNLFWLILFCSICKITMNNYVELHF